MLMARWEDVHASAICKGWKSLLMMIGDTVRGSFLLDVLAPFSHSQLASILLQLVHMRRRRTFAFSCSSFSAIIDSCSAMEMDTVAPPVIADCVDDFAAALPLEPAAMPVPTIEAPDKTDAYLWLEDFDVNAETDGGFEKYDFGLGSYVDENSSDSVTRVEVPASSSLVTSGSSPVAGTWSFMIVMKICFVIGEQEVVARGLRNVPHPELLDAGNGKEKSASANNDRWALRRVDQLRKSLGWNMKRPLGDLPLEDIDELLSNLFARVVKVSGEEYPASTLMNMLGGFNRIIRRAIVERALKGIPGYQVEKDFNIKKHPAFTKTRLVLTAAVKRTAKEGINKKSLKVEIMSEAMEEAIMVDIDHQVTDNHGCQKLLALFLMLRCRIRGGKELYNLMRKDVSIQVDSSGQEYVKFEERHSENNNYNLDRYNEHQFSKVYHSYELHFVVCVKQYMRHMPPIEESDPDLFLQTITSPDTIVWYYRTQKARRDKVKGYLKNMALLVGIPPEVFTNKSGRATLITRLCARGVPDEVGMLISGHYTTDGYLQYDRSQALKKEAVVVVSAKPEISYETTLAEVSRKFVEKKVVGNPTNLHILVMPTTKTESVQSEAMVVSRSRSLKPLVERMKGKAVGVSMCEQVKVHETERRTVRISDEQELKAWHKQESLKAWHKDYDGINWDEEMTKNPRLMQVLGEARSGSSQVSIGSRIGSSLSGNSFVLGSNCTINFICPKEDDKENKADN